MKWTSLPASPLQYHPYQTAFWTARRQRLCTTCKLEFATLDCPKCKQRGLRKYHRFSLISGRRGGKTRAGAIATAEELTVPNTIWWACAPTNPKLHRYIIPAFQELIPDDWVKSWSSEYGDLRLKNGSLLHFQTLEDPDQGRGQGLDGVWIDEASELTEDHWHVLRPSLTERRGVAFLTTSPRSYDWVWEQFHHKAEEGVPGYWTCRYATSDNPIISAEEIADAKATMPDTMFKQEFLADFVIFTGAVYGAAVDSQILHTDEEIRRVIPEWPSIESWRQVIVGIDTGADHPFGAVKAITTELGIVVIGEYLERHRSFVEHAGSIRMLANSRTAKFAINRNERQPMIELAQHGIFCQPAENDVIAGTERVKSWLHAKQLWFIDHPKHPNLSCPMTIRQMKAYRWAEDKAKDGSIRKERVYKKADELPDCLRYLCMTYPMLPKIPVSTDERRDITALPEEMQGAIKRLRRLDDQKNEPEPQDEVGDFWG